MKLKKNYCRKMTNHCTCEPKYHTFGWICRKCGYESSGVDIELYIGALIIDRRYRLYNRYTGKTVFMFIHDKANIVSAFDACCEYLNNTRTKEDLLKDKQYIKLDGNNTSIVWRDGTSF